MNKIQKALISVWDKTGIIELADFLNKNGIEIISTGGTSDKIKAEGIPVTDVSKITKQNEIMSGRVKTLHPNIFGGILFDRNNKDHKKDLLSINTKEIDLVVTNLYPFQEKAVNNGLALKDAIEFIDIGGPSMLRAAAKNYQYVIALCDPIQYSTFIKKYQINKGVFSTNERIDYAKKVFQITCRYDSMINNYFSMKDKKSKNEKHLSFIESSKLRYGENPHQNASFYLEKNGELLWNQLHGKALSYNNYFDIESAINIVYQFEDISCSIIKHSNPCGFGIGNDNLGAYLNAVSTDPVSYFGGVVGFNHSVHKEVANEMNKSFLECIVAPSFSDEAINILKNKKNLRLIVIKKDNFLNSFKKDMFRSVFNGVLFQKKDSFLKQFNEFEVVTKKKPTNNEYNSLLLGWKLVKFVKSNAIIFNNDKKLLGVGAGQMSRIDSVKIAIRKSKENKLKLNGSTMASDAFFPFSDSIELAVKYGVSAVIQPGGSINDQAIIDCANDLNISMIFTKERHFYH